MSINKSIQGASSIEVEKTLKCKDVMLATLSHLYSIGYLQIYMETQKQLVTNMFVWNFFEIVQRHNYFAH